ncbi:hypothetical protein ACM66B_000238 [Microbotryomycetes sp. NB124-2]
MDRSQHSNANNDGTDAPPPFPVATTPDNMVFWQRSEADGGNVPASDGTNQDNSAADLTVCSPLTSNNRTNHCLTRGRPMTLVDLDLVPKITGVWGHDRISTAIQLLALWAAFTLTEPTCNRRAKCTPVFSTGITITVGETPPAQQVADAQWRAIIVSKTGAADSVSEAYNDATHRAKTTAIPLLGLYSQLSILRVLPETNWNMRSLLAATFLSLKLPDPVLSKETLRTRGYSLITAAIQAKLMLIELSMLESPAYQQELHAMAATQSVAEAGLLSNGMFCFKTKAGVDFEHKQQLATATCSNTPEPSQAQKDEATARAELRRELDELLKGLVAGIESARELFLAKRDRCAANIPLPTDLDKGNGDVSMASSAEAAATRQAQADVRYYNKAVEVLDACLANFGINSTVMLLTDSEALNDPFINGQIGSGPQAADLTQLRSAPLNTMGTAVANHLACFPTKDRVKQAAAIQRPEQLRFILDAPRYTTWRDPGQGIVIDLDTSDREFWVQFWADSAFLDDLGDHETEAVRATTQAAHDRQIDKKLRGWQTIATDASHHDPAGWATLAGLVDTTRSCKENSTAKRQRRH